jgi:amidase
VAQRYQATVDALRKSGATVNEQARPGFDFADARRTYLSLVHAATSAGVPADRFQQLAETANQLAPDDESRLTRYARNTTQRHRDWLACNETRQHLRLRWAELFQEYDVLLCPITPTAAIPHDHSEPIAARTIQVNGAPRPYLDQIAWAGVIAVAYLPATMAPVGRTSSGLPVGIQIVGPYLEDRTTIDFARRLADVIGGFEIPPGY